MAKEAKNAPKEQVEVTVENIDEILQKGGLMNDDSFDKAEAEIKDDEDKRKIREAKEIILEARYTELKEVLQLRQRRAEDKATKACLEAVKSAQKELREKKITSTQYREKKREAAKVKREAYAEASKEYDKKYSELRDQFPGYWSYEWDRYDRW